MLNEYIKTTNNIVTNDAHLKGITLCPNAVTNNNLNNIAAHELVMKTKTLVTQERSCTAEIIRYLQVIYERNIHLEMSYSNIFEFCVKELGYSHSAAQRRIAALKLSRDIPQITARIASGTLSLATVAKVNSFFLEEKRTGNNLTIEEKQVVLEKLEAKDSIEAEAMLVSMSSAPKTIREKTKALPEENTLLQFSINKKVFNKLQQAKALSRTVNHAELLEYLLDYYLKHKDPMQKAERNKQNIPNKRRLQHNQQRKAISVDNAKVKNALNKTITRYIPAGIKHKVWLRDQGRCTYRDPSTGRRCEAKQYLEIDHIKAFAMGGRHEEENLRLLCRAHNQQQAKKAFGSEFINKKISA